MKINSDIKNRFVIIMAGGRGERFWPLSREKMPRQLLPLLGKRSFLQQAVDRVLPLVPAKTFSSSPTSRNCRRSANNCRKSSKPISSRRRRMPSW
jgi:mannose-1-phosphate guanylyltransferase